MDELKEKYVHQVLEVIQKEIDKHNQEKETIKNELLQIHNEKIKEEGTQDIIKLEKAIANYEEEKQSFLLLVYEKDINETKAKEVNEILEKMESTKQHLLEEQQQYSDEINKIKGRIYFREEEKPVELREYESDLEKITNELNSLDTKKEELSFEINNITNKNEVVNELIKKTLDKYHISLEKENENENTNENKNGNTVEDDEKENAVEEDDLDTIFSYFAIPDEAKKENENENTGENKNGNTVEEDEKENAVEEDDEFKIDFSQFENDPKQLKTGPTTPQNKIGQIIFEESAVKVLDKSGKLIIEKDQEEYWSEKISDPEFKNRLNQSLEDIKEQIGEEKTKLLDPRISMILEDKGTKEMMMQYAKSIAEKDEQIPFSINYNLKDIYESGRYTLEQIRKINQYAEIAKRQNKGKVTIKKDNLLKRLIGNIKARIEERKLLPAPLKETFGKGKDTVVQGAKSVGLFTSKKIDNLRNFNARQFGREAWGTLKIIGAKTLGYIGREDPLVTQMKVNQIIDKSFNQRLRENVHVDEKVALEKVEASKPEARNQEVVIENPDGTKTTGTRLWSIDDDNTK